MSSGAPSPSGIASAPVFTASEGKVFHRSVYLTEPSRLLARFEASAEAGDWWSPFAAEHAAQLRDAISVAEDHHNPTEERSAA